MTASQTAPHPGRVQALPAFALIPGERSDELLKEAHHACGVQPCKRQRQGAAEPSHVIRPARDALRAEAGRTSVATGHSRRAYTALTASVVRDKGSCFSANPSSSCGEGVGLRDTGVSTSIEGG